MAETKKPGQHATKRNVGRGQARKRVEKAVEIKKEVPTGSNYDLLVGMSYPDFLIALEGLYLSKVVTGNFYIPVGSIDLPFMWNAVNDTPFISASFRNHGKVQGFMADWLTEDMYQRLIHADRDSFGRFFTAFDYLPSLRREMLLGKGHKLQLMERVSPEVEGWLSE